MNGKVYNHMVGMTGKGKKKIQFQFVNEDWMVLNITPKNTVLPKIFVILNRIKAIQTCKYSITWEDILVYWQKFFQNRRKAIFITGKSSGK